MANMRWAWHVARTDDVLNAYVVLVARDKEEPIRETEQEMTLKMLNGLDWL
jgi:hypothetical protein